MNACIVVLGVYLVENRSLCSLIGVSVDVVNACVVVENACVVGGRSL